MNTQLNATNGCDEYVDLNRRRMFDPIGLAMKAMAGRAAAGAGALSAVQSASFARGGSSGARDVIVYVMLRGGADGLTLCVPHADPDYSVMRGDLAVPPPGQTAGAIDLDGFFGLSPAMAPLLPIYQSGELAFVHGAGSTDPTRSHFDAMLYIEGGVPNQGISNVTSGWLGRHIAALGAVDPTAPLRALAIDDVAPITLRGAPKNLAIKDPSDFDFKGYSNSEAERKALLGDMFSRKSPVLADAAEATLETVDNLGAIDFDAPPGSGAVYPSSGFGTGLRAAASIIRADIGLEAIEVDRGGWDHHDNMGPNDGELYGMMEDLSQALAAFRTDLGALMNSVTVVVQSEFGRRVDANGSNGTDHGRGGCMMLMGGHVNGGQVLRQNWQGLSPGALDDLALPVTIDYRDVMIEVLQKRGGNPGAANVFTNHTFTDWNLIR